MKLNNNKTYPVSKIILYYLILTIISGCSTNSSSHNSSSKSIYIGAYWADDILVPYPKLLVFEKDSVSLFNNKGEAEDATILKDSMITFNDYNYFLYSRQKDQLKIYDITNREKANRLRDNIIFRNISQNSKKYDGDIKDLIESKLWNYQTEHSTPNRDLIIKNELYFKDDTLSHFRYYYYDKVLLYTEFEEFRFTLFELEGHIFISLVDSKNTLENPLPIYEISKFNSSEIKWVNHRALKTQIETLNLSDKSIAEVEKDFKEVLPFYICYEAEQKLYYYNGGYYKDGAQGFLRDYNRLPERNKPAMIDKDGYIIFHFNVSCEKKLGRYGLTQMDMNFKETQFDSQLIQSLFTVVNNSSFQWELPLEGIKYCTLGQIKDIKSFVMFKIKNGEVTEVLP